MNKSRKIREALNLREKNVEKDKERIRRRYEENLRIVLGEVRKLVSQVEENEKVVVSADHGELLGEYNMYGHPAWVDEPLLREVPWLEIKRSQ